MIAYLLLGLPYIFAAVLSFRLGEERGIVAGCALFAVTVAVLGLNGYWGYRAYQAYMAKHMWTAAAMSTFGVMWRSAVVIGVCWIIRAKASK